jgi:RNA polymerase sigma factor (sigma-70 family)
MPTFAELPDGSPLPNTALIVVYYGLHDQLGCTGCGKQPIPGLTAEQKDDLVRSKKSIADEIYHKNFAFVRGKFSWCRDSLDEEPEALAIETIYKALRTECRESARYNVKLASFRTWLASIARNVRLDHVVWRTVLDADLVQDFQTGHLSKNKFSEKLDERYRGVLTHWFRELGEVCGYGTRPEELKPLADLVLKKAVDEAADFNPENTAFIVWLSRIAKGVLNWHAIRPSQKLPDVPEYEGLEHVEFEEDVSGMRSPPEDQQMSEIFTNPGLLAAWKSLTPRQRQVVWMMDVEDDTAEEVASQIGRKRGTVFNDHSKGIQKLRHFLSLCGYKLIPCDVDWALIARYRQSPGDLRDLLDVRFCVLLTDWFRKRCQDVHIKPTAVQLDGLVDQTLQNAITRINTFTSESKFIVWLGRIANTVADTVREEA